VELTGALGTGRVAVDTAAFIYLIEEHHAYLPIVEPLFLEVAAGEREIVTSALTLLEVLVVPLRTGAAALAARYEALLTRSRGLRLVDIDRGQLRAAAQLRARHALRTPDALQLAAALSERCSAFVTNDRRLPTLPGLRVLQLDDFRRPGSRA
jgi:predicted nucleic acid-binding protein